MQGNTDAGAFTMPDGKTHPAYEPFLKQFRTDRCDERTVGLARSFEDTAFAIVKHHPQGDERVKLLRNLLELRDITISQVSPSASSSPLA